MANLVILDVQGIPQRLRGKIQRIMLEVRPGTFVWKLPQNIAKAIWESIVETRCSAIMVMQSKSEVGFRVFSHGENRRLPVDNFGISLISYKTSEKPKKATNKDRCKTDTQK